MEPTVLLLLVAFRHRIEEADADSGLQRVATIAGQDIEPAALHAALAELLAVGNIHDPIQLRPGALQCRWCLGLTPRGVRQVLELLRKDGKSADELLASTRMKQHF
jgi:hypothetical protein